MNWTQERGLYFIGDKDPKYVDLISLDGSVLKVIPEKNWVHWWRPNSVEGRWFYLDSRLVASMAGRNGRRVSDISEPDQPAKSGFHPK